MDLGMHEMASLWALTLCLFLLAVELELVAVGMRKLTFFYSVSINPQFMEIESYDST